ncbi:PilC/PilY family type IV pilus protein [Ramlibacter humi]|uniref:Pilus assembly protein PilY n=1 Tax=Ramlibacter humi TaxID=2530451 RepID=A0A4Z0BEB2_9BURK|nr:PilC/PilY family type IV pilus protein [Ramlibacter humi]TFY97031.1 pilus assembly protein PilY [Ramlibacter humi]
MTQLKNAYVRRGAALACGLMLSAGAQSPALAVSLANEPLFAGAAGAKPNLMFILDDSYSMAWEWMPEVSVYFGHRRYGRRASQCNGVAYNPKITYIPPYNADGTQASPASTSVFVPNPITQTTTPRAIAPVGAIPTSSPGPGPGTMDVTVTGAGGAAGSSGWFPDGTRVTVYQTGDASRFIAGDVFSWDANSGKLTIKLAEATIVGTGSLNPAVVALGEPAYDTYNVYIAKPTDSNYYEPLSFTYDAWGNLQYGDWPNSFAYQCSAYLGTEPGKSVFQTVQVGAGEAQNYANWYQYYRNRMSMMKSALSQAFVSINDSYRVGYSTISSDRAVEGKNFVDIRDFDTNQKKKFFNAFNAAVPMGDTPLRGALSKAGQYYANKAYQQTSDPIQYSCQRNYAILSTDGYWTYGGENQWGTPKYGPYDLDGKNVGDQDGSDPDKFPRPMADASKSADTLADVAAYYYKTDLRDESRGNCKGAIAGVDVCKNNVPQSDADSKLWGGAYGDKIVTQHMTTFTLGLGVNGRLKYKPDYETGAGDFGAILGDPAATPAIPPSKDWPAITSDNRPEQVDDLWHAAVNGRGKYFSAGDPAALVTSLRTALNAVKPPSTGAGASAATSSLEPVAGNNDIFLAQFTSGDWTGDVLDYKIDPKTGDIPATPAWSAKAQLDTLAPSSRNIFYASPKSKGLKPFQQGQLNSDGLLGNFSGFCAGGDKKAASGASSPEQCLGMNPSDQSLANDPANLIAYLRGDKTKPYYRTRKNILGDIVNASPLFIGQPPFRYPDDAYKTFAGKPRKAVVLAAANDGMLHAFDRGDGSELWAFIPTDALGRLYMLADNGYSANHKYFVDGSPQMGDIYVGGAWKTIVVGGLNGGGRSYYALDVTKPDQPQLLWEFTNPNLGLSFGNPIITKQADGRWVVAFSSGYNNVSPGDGNGHLFIVDANDGTLLQDIQTYTDTGVPAGNTTTPSGLARLSAWVDTEYDNHTMRFYGGDLNGNVWRFDTDGLVEPKNAALRMAVLTSPDGAPQPITTKPVLAEVRSAGALYPVVYFGTGQYLGAGDLSTTAVQSLYAIRDPMANTSYGEVRKSSRFVEQTLKDAKDTATNADIKLVSKKPVDWTKSDGWRIDFITSGERVFINPMIVLTTIYVATNIPSKDACVAGGTSFIYGFDIASGSSEGLAGFSNGNEMTMGMTALRLQSPDDGTTPGEIDIVSTMSGGGFKKKPAPSGKAPSGLKRDSWRQIVK